jgi:hypothetical protein
MNRRDAIDDLVKDLAPNPSWDQVLLGEIAKVQAVVDREVGTTDYFHTGKLEDLKLASRTLFRREP